MEWYFANEVEDLVVPKDYEQQEMMTSAESWSNWGMNGFGGSSFPKKKLNSDINMTREELTFNGGKYFYTSSKSNNSSMSQELYNNGGSLLWNDFEQFTEEEEEEARINHMDDIFFNSLLEDPTKDSNNTNLGSNANIFEGDMVNSHTFSQPMDWGNGEVSTTCQMPEQYTSDENSLEASVLEDLEMVTAQFTDKTRICFRDAFYRLAESSKQSISVSQDGETMITSNDDTFRCGETEEDSNSESKTNFIDRAVANLMFCKFDFDESDCQNNQTDYNDDDLATTNCMLN